MTAAFQPVGAVARWVTVYQLLVATPVGGTLTYSAAAHALGVDPDTDRRIVQAAARRAARELETVDRHAVEAVPNTGYRVVQAVEHLRLAKRQQRSSSRALARGRSKVVNVDLDALDPQVRHGFEVVAALFAAQLDFNRRTDIRQTRLEDALRKINQRTDRTGDEVAELRARLERLENG
jgi:hypothetical protein